MLVTSFFHRASSFVAVGLLLAGSLVVADPVPPDASNTHEAPKAPPAPSVLAPVEAALQARQYAEAASAAETIAKSDDKRADEAQYLLALALQGGGKHEPALAAADALIAKFPQSRWLNKTVFLKVRSLVAQRKFEAAQKILDEQSHRLLASERKQQIASVLVSFADALATAPDPSDPGAPPADYNKAYNLYKKTLEMEIGRDLRDEVMFKAAGAVHKAGNLPVAIAEFRAYLDEFDPAWLGAPDSPRRTAQQQKLAPVAAGKHIHESRFRMGEAMVAAGQHPAARHELEDLLKLIAQHVLAGKEDPATTALRAEVMYGIVCTYPITAASAGDWERGVKVAQDFLAAFPAHPRSIIVAHHIALTYHHRGRHDEAVAALREFLDGKTFKLPPEPLRSTPLADTKKSPDYYWDLWQKEGLFTIGQIRFEQKQYAAAIEVFQQYTVKFPSGPQWAAAQQQMIQAEFEIALDAIAAKKYADGRKLLDQFLTTHPLDARAPQVMFIFGQLHIAQAQRLASENAAADGIHKAYRHAIAAWADLITKYPGTEPASLALLQTAQVQEEHLNELDKAIETYRRVNLGSSQGLAQQRLHQLTKKHLQVTTSRKFRTSEAASVRVNLRNIEKLTVRRYSLDLEAYFRKTHSGAGVENLDISLIQPDKTWEVAVKDYAKYKPLEQSIEIPFDGRSPGVCIINISEEDYEATTLVIRSDIDVAMRSSLTEMLVYAQDMELNAPAKGVTVHVSDGSKVIASGKTGDDGVLRQKLPEAKDCNSLRFFAIRDGHVASSDQLDLRGLERAIGLTRKGYLYTDRPAYQPGQTVCVRGIIRDVKDGSYRSPAGEIYIVSVADSRGQAIRQEEIKLSEFGSFQTRFSLDKGAPVGVYTISAWPKGHPENPYAGRFNVQQFQLEKMKLTLDFPRNVYFRGEKVAVTVKAEYYWGQPVVGRAVRIVLPDRRMVVQDTDGAGLVKIEFDTTGMIPPSDLQFIAALEGENVTARAAAQLRSQGYHIALKRVRDVVLSGEPVDLDVTTTEPDGKPLGAELMVRVLRQEAVQRDPVLSAVPWVMRRHEPSAEVTVEERKITTDPKTGKATIAFKLEKGGIYTLRVGGRDRFNQPITAQTSVRVSGDDDTTMLRMFSLTDTLKMGQKAALRLHSRIDSGLALVTFDADGFLEHRIVPIKAGFIDIAITVGHEHFPNFSVTATVMDGRKTHFADRPFVVERELKVAVKSVKASYAPGAAGEVEITTTDQLGSAVAAEFSLAMVDEALLAIYPDMTPKMTGFFQTGAMRKAGFAAVQSNGFTYQATTRVVDKTVVAEGERLEREAIATHDLQALRQQAAPPPPPAKSNFGAVRLSRNGGVIQNLTVTENASGFTNESSSDDDGVALNVGGTMTGKSSGGLAFGSDLVPSLGTVAKPRQELPEAGFWVPNVITDKNGKATVKIPMPQTTTQWRLTVRGATVETLLGEATGQVITRQDFFVELKLPEALTEGDEVRPLVRIHNLGDFEGPVEIKLRVGSADKPGINQQSHTAAVKKNQTSEILLDSVKVLAPGATEGMEFIVDAQAGELHDALSRKVPVRPWGMEYAVRGGGQSSGDATAMLELPKEMPYTSRRLSIFAGPGMQRQVIDMALHGAMVIDPVWLKGAAVPADRLQPPVFGGNLTGSDLLAAVSGLEYARAVNASPADQQLLLERVRALTGSLVTQQRGDGGWGWVAGTTDAAATAMSYWALTRAQQMGVTGFDAPRARAEALLRELLKRVASSDYDTKAVVLHALSVGGVADYELVNPLHRLRQSLSDGALAYTALAMANLDRKPMAAELLEVLENKVKTAKDGDRTVAHWSGVGAVNPWLSDPVETTAAATLALMKIKPDSPRIAQAVDYLLQVRGCLGNRPAKAHGPVTAAVAEYFRQGQFADTDFKLRVTLNDVELKTIEHRAGQSPLLLEAPGEMLKEGRNIVRFEMNGRGRYVYAAVLRGFSARLEDPKTLASPVVEDRRYVHSPLEYRGRSLNVPSSSPVKNVEIGQRIRVEVRLGHRNIAPPYVMIEEPLPAGTTLVAGSLQGGFTHHEVRDGRIVMYYAPGMQSGSFAYELVGYSTGQFRAMPTVVRDAMRPELMRLGSSAELRLLAPGEKSADPYVMNDAERFALGSALFEDGQYAAALEQLNPLFDRKFKYNEREVARMLLWIRTTEKFYDARSAVDAFEVLSERYPELTIPFDKILVVGRAYRDTGEFERAAIVYRATIDSSFLRDSLVSAILSDEGQVLGSIDYQEDLWWDYPDSPQAISSLFAISQQLSELAPKAHELTKVSRQSKIRPLAPWQGKDRLAHRSPTKASLLAAAIRTLEQFLTLYPANELADDAAFSMTNALLDLKDYARVVQLSKAFKDRYPKSEYASSFGYMTALGHFWQRDYTPALAAAGLVADGESKDRDLARYILGQIHHAQGDPVKAIQWYAKVKTVFSDAAESIDYFERKSIAIEEVNRFKSGDPVKIELKFRNLAEANLQVYRVDLMKLYLREKNLSGISEVNLAGIKPQAIMDVPLGDGRDYVDKKRSVELKLEGEGAYLLIVRGENLFASGLILVSPLTLEVKEEGESGRVRINVRDEVRNILPASVHVKAIGSEESAFHGAETDLRGIALLEGLQGNVTVIARDGESRYAFHRGKIHSGPRLERQRQAGMSNKPNEINKPSIDYRDNLNTGNSIMQRDYNANWDAMRRSGGKGVQVQQAK